MVLVGLLASGYLGLFVALSVGAIPVHDLKELSSFLNPLMMLVSNVLAFYFGHTTSPASSQRRG